MGSFKLPTLDLAHFLEEGSRRQEFAYRLRDSLIQYGFVKIVNHGIAESSVEQLFDWVSFIFLQHIRLCNICGSPTHFSIYR